ncbi:MAG: SgcJ/EcaC family oxidoreductase [Bryobacteraceae bacterium]
MHDCKRIEYLLLLTTVVTLIFAVPGCQKPAPPAPDTRAADETAIRAALDEQVKAITAGDAAKVASYDADDVVAMAPDAPLTQGRENIQKYLEAMLKAKPEFSFNMAEVKVEVARSGDLAYNWGTGKMTIKNKKGKATETTFKSISMWKKQADGSWKIVVDAWVPDPPATKK